MGGFVDRGDPDPDRGDPDPDKNGPRRTVRGRCLMHASGSCLVYVRGTTPNPRKRPGTTAQHIVAKKNKRPQSSSQNLLLRNHCPQLRSTGELMGRRILGTEPFQKLSRVFVICHMLFCVSEVLILAIVIQREKVMAPTYELRAQDCGPINPVAGVVVGPLLGPTVDITPKPRVSSSAICSNTIRYDATFTLRPGSS